MRLANSFFAGYVRRMETKPKRPGRPRGKVQDAEVRVVMPSLMAAEIEAIAEAMKMSKSAVMRAAFEMAAPKWLTPSERERIRQWAQP